MVHNQMGSSRGSYLILDGGGRAQSVLQPPEPETAAYRRPLAAHPLSIEHFLLTPACSIEGITSALVQCYGWGAAG